MTPYPGWLHVLAWAYLSLSFLCALVILAEEVRRPQKMMIMNLVWPITALYFGPLAVWGYHRSGWKMTREHHTQMEREIKEDMERGRAASIERPSAGKDAGKSPSPEQTAVSVTHCGAGCTLGDLASEWLLFATGWAFLGGEFSTRLLLDLLLAWGFGIVFQYLTIAPMRGLSLGKGMVAAMRADTLSILTFEIGLFAWMALAYYVFFPGPHLKANEAVFWFMMQIGMVIGFFTSYPANILLIRRGWKEKMPQYKDEMESQILKRRIS